MFLPSKANTDNWVITTFPLILTSAFRNVQIRKTKTKNNPVSHSSSLFSLSLLCLSLARESSIIFLGDQERNESTLEREL